jgi:glutamine amidotransferase
MIGIVRCGTGNIGSVISALSYLGAEVLVVETPEQLADCDRVVLPGVGAFREAMLRLEENRLAQTLQNYALDLKKPILGICLGMQVMAELGLEGGETRGLGWFKATVRRIQPQNSSERIPHVGWNEIRIRCPHKLLQGIPNFADFYFVHSFTMAPSDESCVVADCKYADGVTAIVARDNIVGVQFHPEKSQEYGLRMIENFLDWNPS